MVSKICLKMQLLVQFFNILYSGDQSHLKVKEEIALPSIAKIDS